MPIIRSGYRSDKDKNDLQRVYSAGAWKKARQAVLLRSGGLCEFCGQPPDGRQGLDVVHLANNTLQLLRSGADVYNISTLAAGHRRCHSRYAAGHIQAPRFF